MSYQQRQSARFRPAPDCPSFADRPIRTCAAPPPPPPQGQSWLRGCDATTLLRYSPDKCELRCEWACGSAFTHPMMAPYAPFISLISILPPRPFSLFSSSFLLFFSPLLISALANLCLRSFFRSLRSLFDLGHSTIFSKCLPSIMPPRLALFTGSPLS